MTAIRGLGEIALRVNNPDEMQRFYEDVVGLTLMQRFPPVAFFKIADGFEGHTQILALFDRTSDANYVEPEIAKSTVDHIAFAISLDDFESERKRLEGLGLPVETYEFSWVHWRGIFINDPEGNMIEFVCYDASVN
jgi:catechol 2,3-dioxygenase-like lactoylglutathione lyase family enzyme